MTEGKGREVGREPGRVPIKLMTSTSKPRTDCSWCTQTHKLFRSFGRTVHWLTFIPLEKMNTFNQKTSVIARSSIVCLAGSNFSSPICDCDQIFVPAKWLTEAHTQQTDDKVPWANPSIQIPASHSNVSHSFTHQLHSAVHPVWKPFSPLALSLPQLCSLSHCLSFFLSPASSV